MRRLRLSRGIQEELPSVPSFQPQVAHELVTTIIAVSGPILLLGGADVQGLGDAAGGNAERVARVFVGFL